MNGHAKAAMLMMSFLGATGAAHAATITVPGVGAVTFDQNNVSAGGSGNITGTVQAGGATTNISCGYNAVTGQVSGSAQCGLILNGIGLANLERDLVAARLGVASSLQNESTVKLLDNLVQQRVNTEVSLNVAAAGDGTTGSLFGSPSFGSFGFGGGSFLDDDRLGFEKSGHNYVATVGIDHRGGNTLVGGYAGYINTNISLKSLEGKLDSEGWLVGGYLTQVFSRIFSVTGALTYLDTDVDLRRTFTGNNVTASYGHSEFSGSLTANALLVANVDYAFSLLGGVTYSQWDDAAYTDSRGIAFAKNDGDNTYAKVGGIFTLQPTAQVRPYAFATYNRLLSNPAFSGRDQLQLGGGLAVGAGRITGSIEASTVLLQSGVDENTIGLHLRFAL